MDIGVHEFYMQVSIVPNPFQPPQRYYSLKLKILCNNLFYVYFCFNLRIPKDFPKNNIWIQVSIITKFKTT